MAALFVLAASFLLLRGLGLLGVRRLSSWREAGLTACVKTIEPACSTRPARTQSLPACSMNAARSMLLTIAV